MSENQLNPGETSAAVSGHTFVGAVIGATMLIGLPLLGILLSGRPVGTYLQFPPLTLRVGHAPFSWGLFGLYAGLDLVLVLAIALLIINSRPRGVAIPATDPGAFPAWGWVGLLVTAAGWFMAWTRFDWFANFQGHTFCLPWIGYIMVINALSVKRSGTCLFTIAGKRFIVLVVGSAVFWWFFEYLNRFVQNWYYVGVADMGAPAYTLFASLSFATVLPAVVSTQYWLLTFDLLGRGLQTRPLPQPVPQRMLGAAVLVVAALGLAFLGIRPDQLFSLVWFAPLLIITGLQTLAGRPTIFAPLARGDWRWMISAALAALICGFFWELWNIGSLARWQYSIPYVDRFHLFAMPILGYGGYLPFGLECLLIGSVILGPHRLHLSFQERTL